MPSVHHLFALGRTGCRPLALSRTHPSRASPHVAGTTQSVTIGVVPAATGISAVQTTASAAVLGYLRTRRLGESRLKTLWAPLAAAMSLAAAVALLTVKSAGDHGFELSAVALLPIVAVVVGVLGMGLERRRARAYMTDAPVGRANQALRSPAAGPGIEETETCNG